VHKREINQLYPDVDVHVRQMDAGEEKEVKEVVDEALEKYGRLDIMFANAGILCSMAGIMDSTADDFMRSMKTNALG